MNKFSHEPVLLNEVLTAFDYLKDKGNAIFVDGTVGLAGHAAALARESNVKSRKLKVIAIDKDEEALKIAKSNFSKLISQNYVNVIYIHDDFHNIDEILKQTQIPTGSPFGRLRQAQDDSVESVQDDNLIKTDMIDGMLLDLGVSSMQLDDKDRGFSFEDPGAPLDMRMDPTQDKSAKEVLNNYSISELEIMLRNGEEKHFKQVARNIADARQEKHFETVGDLINVLEKSVPKKYTGKNFATDTFRALRLEVNDEIAPLKKTIEDIIPHLNNGAKLAIITFHSLEDRIVKQTFRKLENPCECPPEFPYCTCGKKPSVKIITKKPIEPSDEEIANNPRARSAKLRIIEKNDHTITDLVHRSTQI